MGWILKIFAVLVGVFMMCMVTRTAKQKKMNVRAHHRNSESAMGAPARPSHWRPTHRDARTLRTRNDPCARDDACSH